MQQHRDQLSGCPSSTAFIDGRFEVASSNTFNSMSMIIPNNRTLRSPLPTLSEYEDPFIIHDPNACWCSGCKRKIEIGSVILLCLNCPFGRHIHKSRNMEVNDMTTSCCSSSNISQSSMDGNSQNSNINSNNNTKGYMLCNKCGKDFSKHHLKKGHCFVTMLNRRFSYEALLESARFDTLSSKISSKCISKNGVLVVDGFCKVESSHIKSNCWLFTKPKELFADEEIQIFNDKVIHRRVTCDGCECTIHGTRYCCLNCADFDLCSNCMKQHLHHGRSSMLGTDTSIDRSTMTVQNIANTEAATAVSHNPNHVFLQTLLPLLNRPQQLSKCIFLDGLSENETGTSYMNNSVNHGNSSLTWNSSSPTDFNNSHNYEQQQSSMQQHMVIHTTNSPQTLGNNTTSGLIDLTQSNPNITIIPYNSNIFDLLYEIECLSFSKAYNRELLLQLLNLSLYNSLDKPVDYFAWVALVNTEMVHGIISTNARSHHTKKPQQYVAGFIMYNVNKEKERAEISSFAVHPSLRSHGIGRELLRYSLSHILNYEWLWVVQQKPQSIIEKLLSGDLTTIGVTAFAIVAISVLVNKIMGSRPTKPVEKSSPSTTTTTSTQMKKEESVISAEEYRPFKLIEKKSLTEGENVKCPVRLFRFELPAGKSLGLPVGQHISLKATINGEEVARSYTPTSSNDDKGFFDLVVKIYPKGLMTQHLDTMKIGDTILVSGPKGRFNYEKNKYSKLGMIAGGTGITPMLQVIEEILKHPDDKTEIALLYGNLTEQDIILRDRLEELARKHPQFTLYHVLNEPPTNWTQGVGFITQEMIEKYLPTAGEKMNVLMCGPPPMLGAMKGHLEKLGMKRGEHYFSF
ncbi:hypothetical protein C9374_007251 [Naegleria lovaniensis]|uniref:cytochrome-b5 reductase n=1 Tax=Naegleria lovaniensis TaxID=51637 RepID=A0AA88H301_NAELO|nr:uncharacterized protein C9374_007251 [Naegleria lovaniensis]KAG2393720.1 hypothetical protein C9374_007251 [Naegleria lovaniensis]